MKFIEWLMALVGFYQYARVQHIDGAAFFTSTSVAQEFNAMTEDPADYTTTNVWMRRKTYMAMREFEGF